MEPPNKGTTFPFAPPPDGSDAAPPGASPPPKAEASSKVERYALRALKEALANVPHGEKSSLVHAQRIRPGLVDDDHLMGFLWAEEYDVDLALTRLVRYWKHRRKVFGEDKFALPMTLNGAMRDDIDALKKAAIHLLPVPDAEGRAIIYIHDNGSKPHADQKIRALWYLLHVAASDRKVAKKGFVIVGNAKYSSVLAEFSPKWGLAVGASGDRAFPIRWKMAHILHMNATFPLIAPAVKAVLTPAQRERFLMHNGTDEVVLQSLLKYSFSKQCLPTDVGGTVSLSMDDFLQERLAIEGGAASAFKESSEKMPSSPPHSAMSALADGIVSYPRIAAKSTGMLSHADPAGGSMPRIDGTSSYPRIAAKSTGMLSHDDPAGGIMPRIDVSDPLLAAMFPNSAWTDGNSLVTSAFINPFSEDATSASTQMPPAAQKRKCDETKLGEGNKRPRTAKAHPGRTGDPRMNRAVQNKIDNPSMAHLDALVAAGYVFPDMGKPGTKMDAVKDSEGVTLYQRRNQLIRRLRTVKKKLEREM